MNKTWLLLLLASLGLSACVVRTGPGPRSTAATERRDDRRDAVADAHSPWDNFAPNTKTRVIDLPGGARVIRRVEFRYGNLPGGGRAQVELWGV
jgi:hypothetical protein